MTWPLEASNRAVPGVGGEVVLAGEPTDVTDLAQEPGRQHRPHSEQLQQAGVGLDNRGLDARLHRGDALLQPSEIGHELAGQLPTGDRRRAGGHDPGQQGGGTVGGEGASGAAGGQAHQHPMEPVDGLGAGGHQVLAALGQQVQHHRLVLDPDRAQLWDAPGRDGR